MGRKAAIAIGLLTLTACGERAQTAEPTPSETVAATPAATSDAVAAAPVVLDASGLKRVCQAGLAAIHGQQPGDIAIDGT